MRPSASAQSRASAGEVGVSIFEDGEDGVEAGEDSEDLGGVFGEEGAMVGG